MSSNITRLDKALRSTDNSVVGVAIVDALPAKKERFVDSSWHTTDAGVHIRVDWDHPPTRNEILNVDPVVSDENLQDDTPTRTRNEAKGMMEGTSSQARAIRALLYAVADAIPTITRQELQDDFERIIDQQG